MATKKPQSGTGTRAEDTRRAILRAAISEFAEVGPAGARTDSIARSAGVNKALLHYHFGNKEALYAAALDEVFEGFLERQMAVLNGPGTHGERILRYFLTHFQHIAEHGSFPRMLEYEMMRARKGHRSHIPRLVEKCFGPLSDAVHKTIREGIGTGEFRRVDPGHFALSMVGVNVFYFISAPVMRCINGRDPRSPEMLQERRVAMLDLCAAALFADREHGAMIARQVLSTLNGPKKKVLRGKLK